MFTAIFDFDGKALQILRLVQPKMHDHGILRIVNDEILNTALMAVHRLFAYRRALVGDAWP